MQMMTQLSAAEAVSSHSHWPQPATVSHRDTTSHRNMVVNHILAPLDGSTLAAEALPYVAAVAKASNARVTLLRILESGLARQPVDAFEWELARGEAQAYLARIQSDFRTAGVAVETHIVDGRPSEQVLHFAAVADVDLIVLASHGEGGDGQWPLSGTAHKIVAGTSSSLMVVPARRRQGSSMDLHLRRILLGLDCSQRSECTVPIALSLAQTHDAEILLAHCVPEPQLPRRLPPAAREVELARQVTESNHREAQRYLRELQTRLARDWPHTQVHTVVASHAARALRQIANDAQVDLIVVAAHGATGDPDVTHGSVAASLLSDPSHPVIIVQDLCPRRAPRAEDEAPAAEATSQRRS
jgi:nucleotide-binding universal stress UspA family protein